jgi:hypothetical protein
MLNQRQNWYGAFNKLKINISKESPLTNLDNINKISMTALKHILIIHPKFKINNKS